MRRLIQLSLILLAFAFTTNTAIAQNNIAHVDAQSVILEMAEFKQARSSLLAMENQFQKQLQAQQEKIKTRLLDADKKYQRGELSPAQQKTIETELQGEQQKLLENEQKYQADLIKKEKELTDPLYDKIRNAIKTVAKDNGYRYVLEAASLLYAEESDDITARVKAKLGM